MNWQYHRTECFLEKCISRYNETYWHNKVLKVHHVKDVLENWQADSERVKKVV